ncbi:jg3555 [Pararge aegeria aegeria]|uniref:Jg3555 protein n=1 Tax=Pararge aegeria aegeria TaxID=348720 RepID=A0A8S4QIX7_9NEOP|nr:jg3555 [Pararge aegeria aegeria]
MPGVKIEAWRGKKGPAQCHQCQQFRHSSHYCHRKQACVRCGEEHRAYQCPRPKDVPATCANCGGPHPANNLSCPVFRHEIRNKRAGTVAATAAKTRDGPLPRSDTQAEHAQPPTAPAGGLTSGPPQTTRLPEVLPSNHQRKRGRGTRIA